MVGNLGLNLLLGGYQGSAMVGLRYSCLASSPAATGNDPAEAPGAWPPPDQAVNEPEPVAQSLEERFERRLENRFRQDDTLDEAALSLKAERLKAAAVEIGGTLGQAKANEFMSKVLAAADTPDDVRGGGESAELAAETLLGALTEAAKDDPATYQKLEEVSRFLTAGRGPGEGGLPAAPGEARGRLYQNYVLGRSPASAARVPFGQPLGNLVNAFA